MLIPVAIVTMLVSQNLLATTSVDLKSCLSCHQQGRITSNQRHVHAALKLEHMKKTQDCKLCHNLSNMSELKLLTGEIIPSSSSPLLCGQCHGLVKRDWDHGVHGKRTKSWSKQGERLACSQCHESHAPKFPQMKADPAPLRPKLGIEKEVSHAK